MEKQYQGRIELWQPLMWFGHLVVVGEIKNSVQGVEDGSGLRTSPVVSYDTKSNRVETQNSLYELGSPAIHGIDPSAVFNSKINVAKMFDA